MTLLAVPAAGCCLEGNRPTAFRHPFFGLLGYFVMFRNILRGRLPR